MLFALEELRLEGPLLTLLLALVPLPLLLPETETEPLPETEIEPLPETETEPLPEPALRILMKELLHWDSPFLPHRGQPCKDIRIL